MPCVELIWSRRGLSIFYSYITLCANKQKNNNQISWGFCARGCTKVRNALWGVLVCVTLVDDVICAVDGFHRLENEERRE